MDTVTSTWASFSRPGHRKGLGMPTNMDRRGKEEETGTRAQSGSVVGHQGGWNATY